MEFWDGTRCIRHIRRGPPELPVKTILVLLAGGITVTAWLYPAQRHVQLAAPTVCPPAGALTTPMASAPDPTGPLGRLLPPRPGLPAGPTPSGNRPAALRAGSPAPVGTSARVPGAPVLLSTGTQAVMAGVTPSMAPSGSGDEPSYAPMLTPPSATPTPTPSPTPSPSPSASPTHPGKGHKSTPTPSPS